jgi:hypothetical protein
MTRKKAVQMPDDDNVPSVRVPQIVLTRADKLQKMLGAYALRAEETAEQPRLEKSANPAGTPGEQKPGSVLHLVLHSEIAFERGINGNRR